MMLGNKSKFIKMGQNLESGLNIRESRRGEGDLDVMTLRLERISRLVEAG